MNDTTGGGTVLITGPTGGLGRAATLAMARRPAAERPDLLLVGRPGAGLSAIAAEARAAGAGVREIGADLSRLDDVRAAAARIDEVLAAGELRPLRALVANAGVTVTDTRTASADGHELTFAVNHLAHAQLIGDLLERSAPPARIVLVGSETYWENRIRRILGVPPAEWRDPLELARPADPGTAPTAKAAGVAYATSKLAALYYAHELQRRAPEGVSVAVFEPGFMPGTGLARGHGAAVARIGQVVQRLPIPGVSNPDRSGPALAAVALDARWAHLRDGGYVLIDDERRNRPVAYDRAREERLWEATEELLRRS
ncbi:SDR family NAD(P)-dependent oxidoreductase [Pseudonocardia ailaonensis]